MAVMPTDWHARAQEMGDLLILVDGQRKPWPFLRGSDAPVEIDMADHLAVGESLTNPVLKLWRMYALGETADADVTATAIPDAPVISGATIQQRVKTLDAGRYYLLEVLHGAAGNRRGPGMIIRCSGGMP